MPKCTIDGVEYDEIPVDKNGEPAFLGDGGPNPNFDWADWEQDNARTD